MNASAVRKQDPALWAASVLVLVAALHGLVVAASWVGQTFPGFLMLENRVVPSAGLSHWPAVEGGRIFQHEVVSVDGKPLRTTLELDQYIASLPVGTPVTYSLRSGAETFDRRVRTRLFTAADSTLLFGSFLFCGLGLCGVALVIRFLRRDDPAARGSATALWLIGMWALTATDLYGPFRLFRLHAFFECLIFAGTFHLALVFPAPRRLAVRFPRLPGAIYGAAVLLALWNQMGLHDPDTYVQTHRVAMAAFGVAAFTLIGAMVWSYIRPPSFIARERVKLLALGSVASLTPQVLLTMASAASGGQAPENLMGWSGIFFPIAVAYAVLRIDLFGVDAILRRTVNYALLTGIVACTYAALVGAIEPLVRSDTPGTQWTSAVVIAATLSLGVLPLRDRVQSLVNRLFFRTAFDFRRTVDEISARLAATTDLSVVTRLIEDAVSSALSPASIALELAGPGTAGGPSSFEFERVPDSVQQGRRGQRRSRVVERADRGLTLMFIAENHVVARMVMGRPLSGRFYSGDDRRFLVTLANQGALAIQNSLAVLRLQELNQTLEQKVAERTSELAKALEELQTTQQQMVHQEKMASVGQLVAGVAHEINNPLNFITGNLFHLRVYADTMKSVIERYEDAIEAAAPELAPKVAALRDELDLDFVLSDLEGIFAGCEEGVRRTTTIVRDLRTFSRLDSGPATRVDLRAALDTTLSLLRTPLANIDVRKEYQDGPLVECNEGQLSQVFMNLMSNAVDALEGEGTLTLRVLYPDDSSVRIEVEDDGAGIPADRIDQIFEPFYTSKDVGKGTGLGLTISYGVVTRHGGRIEVESEVGRGSVFRVDLPVDAAPQQSDLEQTNEAANAASPRPEREQ